MLITVMVQLVQPLSLGVIVGKILADCFFYGMAIVGRQMSQRLTATEGD
jgi:hypothetical protein